MVFLKRSSNDKYVFSNPHNALPITNKLVPLPKVDLDTFELLEMELIHSLKDENKEVFHTAIEQLGNLPKVKTTEPLKELLSLKDKVIQGRVLSSLIKLGDYSKFEEAIRFIETHESDYDVRRLQGLITSAVLGIRDEKMLPQLHKLMQSQNTSLRQYALDVIRRIKSPEIVKYLLEGLEDSDKQIRHACVIGLAEVERKGPEWGPLLGSDYDENEQAYISRWKNWWEEEGKRRYSTK